ncbi:MAG: hypothetical protein IPP37_14290 [Saprospiraceae bacterium]|nr:hypothetical protein [Saprospiraceae bacterium]
MMCAKEISGSASGKINTSLSASEFDLENLSNSPKLITSKFNGKDEPQGGGRQCEKQGMDDQTDDGEFRYVSLFQPTGLG